MAHSVLKIGEQIAKITTLCAMPFVHIDTWILHELEASIGKALQGEAIVHYASPLITQHMGASGSPAG